MELRGALIDFIGRTDALAYGMPTFGGSRLSAPAWTCMTEFLMPRIVRATGQEMPPQSVAEVQAASIETINGMLQAMGGLACTLDLPDTDGPHHYTLLQWQGYDPEHEDPHMVWRIGDGRSLGEYTVPSAAILSGLHEISQ